MSLRSTCRSVSLALMAIFTLGICLVSCGNGSVVPQAETTTEKSDISESIYERIEIGMGYDEVVKIVGNEPNEALEVPDEFAPGGRALKCTWYGSYQTEGYGETRSLQIVFESGTVSEKYGENLD